MSEDRLDAAVRAARAAEPEVMDRDQLAQHLRRLAAIRAWVDAAEVRAARRGRQLADQGRAEAADAALARQGRRSGREAKAAAERERVCDELPGFEAALEAGSISGEHVDAVAAATRNLDEEVRDGFADHVDGLVDQASRVGVDTFGRACRDLARTLAARHRADSEVSELEQQRAMSKVRRWVDRSTGMHHTRLELDPIRATKLWAAIDHQLRRLRLEQGNGSRSYDQLQTEAAVAAFGGVDVDDRGPHGEHAGRRADDRPGGAGAVARGAGRVVDRVPEITVLIDYERLVDDAHVAGICETEDGIPLPVATVRRLCCDAEVLPVVFDGDGVPVDHGRSRRTVNREQRRRLRAMHRTCGHPDCEVGFSHCRIHHVRWWWRDHGPSDIANMLPLCDRHHHLVHEGGWGLTMTPDRVATWTRPDGSVYERGPTTDRVPASRVGPPSRNRDTRTAKAKAKAKRGVAAMC